VAHWQSGLVHVHDICARKKIRETVVAIDISHSGNNDTAGQLESNNDVRDTTFPHTLHPIPVYIMPDPVADET
jgi:hypothetical protein